MNKNKSNLILITLLLFFMMLALGRNMVWHHAIPLWGDSVSKSFNKVRTHNGLGLAYMRGGFYKESLLEFQVVLASYPLHLRTHNNLGALYFSMEEYDSAESQFLGILRLDPNNMTANFNRAVIFYLHRGKLEEAERILLPLLVQYPSNAKILYTIGEVYRLQGRIVEAISYYNKAIALDSNYQLAIEAIYELSGG